MEARGFVSLQRFVHTSQGFGERGALLREGHALFGEV
jgi:hypothetical protein